MSMSSSMSYYVPLFGHTVFATFQSTIVVYPSDRNPDRAARPSAKHIAQELCSPALNLAMGEDSNSVPPNFALGAPLEEGKALYPDLQTKYS